MKTHQEQGDRKALAEILQAAYSGELAAAHAYRGHWKSVKKRSEREQIQKIEHEEWDHRERVGRMLKELGEEPVRFKEVKLGAIGRVIGVGCHLIGWFLPMYFAGRLESQNVGQYDDAALYARNLELVDFEVDLRDMADVEREHEDYFEALIVGHRMFPLMRKIFGWGGRGQLDQPSAAVSRDVEQPRA